MFQESERYSKFVKLPEESNSPFAFLFTPKDYFKSIKLYYLQNASTTNIFVIVVTIISNAILR